MLDWCLCRRTMNHCLSMLESKHKGCYEYKKLFLLISHPSTYHSVATFSTSQTFCLTVFWKKIEKQLNLNGKKIVGLHKKWAASYHEI